jgi:hypothetical protein
LSTDINMVHFCGLIFGEEEKMVMLSCCHAAYVALLHNISKSCGPW